VGDGRPDKIDSYRMVAKLRINLSKVQGVNLFRVRGWDVPLIVSGEIKEKIEKNRFVGVVFELVS